jgi:hypothetical protein
MRTTQAEGELITKIIWRVMREEGGWRPEQVGVTNIRARKAGGFSARVTVEKIAPSGRVASRQYRATIPTPGSDGKVRVTATGPAGWQEEGAT